MDMSIEEIVGKADKINPDEFLAKHPEQVQEKSQKDIFFIWMVLMFIAVFAAHFVIATIGGSPTGFVTVAGSATDSGTMLLGSLMVTFITVLIVGIVHVGITKRDR